MATVNINTLKAAIKSQFDTSNTTTASPDLSQNLTQRIGRVVLTNPERIQPQASFFPCIAIYLDSKDITLESTLCNQSNSKRRADFIFKIAGIFWNQNFTDVDENPANEDCEYLMESIEENLRSDETFGGVVTWSMPESVEYFSTVLDEQVQIRAGVLDLKVTQYY